MSESRKDEIATACVKRWWEGDIGAPGLKAEIIAALTSYEQEQTPSGEGWPQRIVRVAFMAGVRARQLTGVRGPWSFPEFDPATCAVSMYEEAFGHWWQGQHAKDARPPAPPSAEWQSTMTLRDHRQLVWLWTPAWKLSDRTDQQPDMRVSTLADWTWATMWQPCPMPRPPAPEGSPAKTDEQRLHTHEAAATRAEAERAEREFKTKPVLMAALRKGLENALKSEADASPVKETR